jgi:hypothetical protein
VSQGWTQGSLIQWSTRRFADSFSTGVVSELGGEITLETKNTRMFADFPQGDCGETGH